MLLLFLPLHFSLSADCAVVRTRVPANSGRGRAVSAMSKSDRNAPMTSQIAISREDASRSFPGRSALTCAALGVICRASCWNRRRDRAVLFGSGHYYKGLRLGGTDSGGRLCLVGRKFVGVRTGARIHRYVRRDDAVFRMVVVAKAAERRVRLTPLHRGSSVAISRQFSSPKR